MASGLRETTKPQFEIYYEQPWGGVASDKDPVDIQPNQLVVQLGVTVVDNVLCYSSLVADPVRFQFHSVTTNATPSLIFEIGGLLYAIDQFSNMYLYNPGFPITGFNSMSLAAPDIPWGTPPSAVQIINGQAYISNYGRHSIYIFTPAVITPPAPATFTLASNFVGGGILGVLDDYLLQMNVNQVVDGLQPNRVNNSGPGKFSTWDPSIDRTAGFNTLAAVEDQITGFLSYSSVGIIITQKGLVEVSPTGVAISPFQFTALWTSQIGQGCTYPNTVSQYGMRGLMTTDSGVYSATTAGGFQDVTGSAKKAILISFQTSDLVGGGLVVTRVPLVAGCIFLYNFNSAYATPFYLLVASPRELMEGNQLIAWLLDLNSGIWQEQAYNVDTLINQQHGTSLSGGIITALNAVSIDPSAGFFFEQGPAPTQTFANPVTLVYATVQYGLELMPLILTPYIFNAQNADSSVAPPGDLALTFRAEEIKLGREPTIRRVLVKAYGSGTLALSVSGVSFGSIVLDGTLVARTYFSPTGVFTGEAPQLFIKSTNFKGVIIKVMLGGAYADGDVD